MYIEPNTNIRVLNNVPLDNTYENTLYFVSASAQSSYFISLTKYNLTNYTYQRVNKGKARIGIKADNLYDCNYMMFQNSGHGNKWFYAFITSVEFINNECAEITFEIDVMQTWLFDYQLKETFIERMTTPTDNVGEWIQPENVDLGDYVTSYETPTNLFNSYSVLIMTADVDDNNPPSGMWGGLYNGVRYIAGLADTEEQINLLNDYLVALVKANMTDAVVSIIYVPTAMLPTEPGTPKVYTTEIDKHISDLGGYIPKNKKLLTYPYNFLMVSNNQGNFSTYKYERFTTTSEGKMVFTVATQCSANPSIGLFAQGYKGEIADYDNTLFISSFPQCSFAYDTYRAWVAQGGGITTALSLVGAGASIASGNVAGGILGAGATISNLVQVMNAPDQLKGSVGGNWYIANKFIDYRFMQRHILPQYAKIIDDYFSKYGYAYNQFGTINRDSRPHWNYVKTRGIFICGNLPSSDASIIASIYNKGITWWKNGNEVGNYSLDNSV